MLWLSESVSFFRIADGQARDTRLCGSIVWVRRCGSRGARISHLKRDEAALKMGHPASWRGQALVSTLLLCRNFGGYRDAKRGLVTCRFSEASAGIVAA